MPVSRMRMRPWLEKMIESQAIPGLTWMDREKTTFSIPWKHAARHGWEMDKDASLFKEWAIHTGKYVKGHASDPKTWKANFRCAMNSLPDIEEVKDKSINKGHQAVRVFRMLPPTPKSRDKRNKAKEARHRRKNSAEKMREDSDDSDTQLSAPGSVASTQEHTVDSTVKLEQQDLMVFSPSEAPDFSHSVEIGPDSYSSNFPHKFEVSPIRDTDYSLTDDGFTDDIIEICAQLERDSYWLHSSLEDRGFLDNEACTSPGSSWSDSSSGDDLDIPEYTTLGTIHTDSHWSSFTSQLNFPSLM